MKKKILMFITLICMLFTFLVPVLATELNETQYSKEEFLVKVKQLDIYKKYEDQIIDENLIDSKLDDLYRVTVMFRLPAVEGNEKILMISGDENHQIVLIDEITYEEERIVIYDYLINREITMVSTRSIDCNTSVCMEKVTAPYSASQCQNALGYVCNIGKWAGYYGRVGTYVCKAGVAIGCNWMTRQKCARYQNMPICVA